MGNQSVYVHANNGDNSLDRVIQKQRDVHFQT
jgi:hypothetical protein